MCRRSKVASKIVVADPEDNLITVLIPVTKKAYESGLPLLFLVGLQSEKRIPDMHFKDLAHLSSSKFSLRYNMDSTSQQKDAEEEEGDH
ncbi:hypothetical protein IFR04_014607 [Cadophora malorum]|uniref:Uncharacterized protein n=1 Tax=Cadophora malorum TaxID=108018 RepID=A0A8H7W4R8_9HELO|nr:hypothetical protein IFR04_014607 [Cadophora malorum]